MLLHCFVVLCIFVQPSIVAVIVEQERLYENDVCSDGVCKRHDQCPGVSDLIQQGFRPKICSFDNRETPILCCPTTAVDYKTDQTLSEKMCQRYSREICPGYNFQVAGGELVNPKELPFMALIGYGRTKIEWKCGGSLISKRYVLSAAHCTTLNGEKATTVRLGDLDHKDSNEDAKPIDYQILNHFDHPDYSASEVYNDIALYRLDKDVIFNDYIRPICININPRNATKATAAGWGRTDSVGPLSPQLLKVELDIHSLDTCSNLTLDIKRLPKNLTDDMICAGTIGGGKDTCSGDSGGPLFYEPTQKQIDDACYLLSQIGITSFGLQCGVEPAIYTNVLSHQLWIESIVWPQANLTDLSIWD